MSIYLVLWERLPCLKLELLERGLEGLRAEVLGVIGETDFSVQRKHDWNILC